MLRVTRLTDYGIVVMTFLAAHPVENFKAHAIAAAIRLPLPVVSKALKMLAREGLLISRRGVRGGYGLSRPPRQIAVADIIRALEGPIALTECSHRSGGECGLSPGCAVRANWNLINGAIRSALEKITLAEMARLLRRLLVDMSPAGDFLSAGRDR